MPTALETEAIFTAIGLMPILEARPRLTKYRLANAAATGATLRRRLQRFLGSSTFAEAAEMPKLDYRKILDLVSQETPTAEQSRALFAAVPDPDLANDLGLGAGVITKAANALIPREPPNPITLQPTVDPDPTATNDFARFWQVACDPMAVLADLEDGSLIEEQVATLAQLYPATYAEVRQAANDALTTMIARRGKKWEPDPAKATLIATLLQRDVFDAQLAATVQQSYMAEAQREAAAAPPPPRRARQASGAEPGGEQTPGQQAASS